jgi:bacillithiol biosynthesis cysteine-adding enzyme BshC
VLTECFPVAKLPHVTRLFSDYVSGLGPIQELLPRPGEFKIQQAAIGKSYGESLRRRVCDVLYRQNRAWDASGRTIANIELMRRGAACAVTGQQVGLFGGPLYSLFKALTAIRLAEQATASGVECVPVFWLATEDHDVNEVNLVKVVSHDGVLHSLRTEARGWPNAPVRDVVLGEGVTSSIDALETVLGSSEAVELVRACYQPGESLGRAFARLLAELFREWGLVVLDPSEGELHQAAEPIYRQAIERSRELYESLLDRGRQLRAFGYHEQVNVAAAGLLFAEQNGARTAVRRGGADTLPYRIGQERLDERELLRNISERPERFSPNVLLRPVVQDYLLPTIVYTGGPAEVAYFAQGAVLYEKLLGRVTPVVPRFSATLVGAKEAKLLDRYRLTFADVFQGPEHVRSAMAERVMPSDLRQAFGSASAALDDSLNVLQDQLARLDHTLGDAAKHASAKMKYQLQRLHARAEAAELRRSEVLERHANFLTHMLFPDNNLQERELGGVSFLARHGTALLTNLFELVRHGCPDHQIIHL